MKKFISKIKKSCHRFITGKSGFSLVELIVVIAIMAVMAAVLAPALLGYVERSRAQKDDSAMGEVTNAIKLSLADQNVYDELLPYAVKGNFSCYCDGDTSTNTDANKTITKAPDYWFFTDEARKLDETPYKPAGSMRGATVTFKPNGEAEYILKAGVVNQIGDESTKKGANGGAVLEDCPELYNRLRSTVGDTIKVSSQTYRNSTYTIFISMGTTGGNQATAQDAIQVYGQYNGTNLPEVMTATGSASQDKGNAGSNIQTPVEPEVVFDANPSGIIPEGAIYNIVSKNQTLQGGSNFPSKIGDGTSVNSNTDFDEFIYGDYKYTFWPDVYPELNSNGMWHVVPLNKNQTTYGPICETIGGYVVGSVYFSDCQQMTEAPRIPNSVYELSFSGCKELTSVPNLPSNLYYAVSLFEQCSKLTSIPQIPSSTYFLCESDFIGSNIAEINAPCSLYGIDRLGEGVVINGGKTTISYYHNCNGWCSYSAAHDPDYAW